jgi:hypothetical protein
VPTLTSQIDYAPTLLGLLGWSYPSRFFGRDVLAPATAAQPGRALIGNYQRLGLYVDQPDANLAVLAPVRAATTFHFDESAGVTTEASRDAALLADTIAYYEAASNVFKHGRQNEYPAPAR